MLQHFSTMSVVPPCRFSWTARSLLVLRWLFCTVLLLPEVLSWDISVTSTPTQCGDVVIAPLQPESGPDGEPPFYLLIVPLVRTPRADVFEVEILASVRLYSVEVDFPEKTQFVIVGSDRNGFGRGGTSRILTVEAGIVPDTSCLQDHALNFTWSINPQSISYCDPTVHIDWNSSDVQGTPTFRAVIPGGNSFIIPLDNRTSTGFTWTPSLPQNSTVYVVAGDDRGPGSGGVFALRMEETHGDCASTLLPAAPTSTTGGSTSNSTSASVTTRQTFSATPAPDLNGVQARSHTNVGAIVGGTLGGVFGVGLLLLSFLLGRRYSKSRQAPVDAATTSTRHNPIPHTFNGAATYTAESSNPGLSSSFPLPSPHEWSDARQSSVSHPSTGPLLLPTPSQGLVTGSALVEQMHEATRPHESLATSSMDASTGTHINHGM